MRRAHPAAVAGAATAKFTADVVAPAAAKATVATAKGRANSSRFFTGLRQRRPERPGRDHHHRNQAQELPAADRSQRGARSDVPGETPMESPALRGSRNSDCCRRMNPPRSKSIRTWRTGGHRAGRGGSGRRDQRGREWFRPRSLSNIDEGKSARTNSRRAAGFRSRLAA